MTSENIERKGQAKNLSPVFYRWMYGAFVLMTVYFLFRADYMTAASNLGIALIFDPFNPSVKWQDRKNYQKVWLFVHVALVIAFFVYGMLR
ncbi:MAG: hypothetical protein ABL872_08350 [Lacibacter sp.]